VESPPPGCGPLCKDPVELDPGILVHLLHDSPPISMSEGCGTARHLALEVRVFEARDLDRVLGAEPADLPPCSREMASPTGGTYRR
jgi:hypothetical protein